MAQDSKIIFSTNICSDIASAISGTVPEQVFVITDTESARLCYPLIKDMPELAKSHLITIKNGDGNKNLETVAEVWKYLCEHGGTRRSLVINLGGGMVTDLGGFVANTFKRGIDFVNIPTTLLSMVDAAVGGKTGINFLGFKNEIGVINPARTVIISADFLKTLDRNNILSGYAEMLKHGILSNENDLNELLSFDTVSPDYELLGRIVEKSVKVKEVIVEQDPREMGIRKALNLGHTIGHAFESYSHTTNHPALHGYAVAWGMVGELYLSYKKLGFPTDILNKVVRFIKEEYGPFVITCDDYENLYTLMLHDKKNMAAGEVNFTLMSGIGGIVPNCIIEKKLIFEALDFYRDAMGI